MFTEVIIRQTTLGTDSRLFQQLCTMFLTGYNTRAGVENSDHGRFYASFAKSGGNYNLDIYKDITKAEKVLSATTATLPGVVNFTEENNSGLSGYILLLQYTADDLAITMQGLLSMDEDIPLANLATVQEFDPTVGFAEYHQLAWKYLTHEFILSRLATMLYNTDYTFLPEGITDATKTQYKGYDLSRINNIDSLREASSWWVLSRICEKHAVEKDGSFQVKATESRNRVSAILNAVDLSIDTRSQ